MIPKRCPSCDGLVIVSMDSECVPWGWCINCCQEFKKEEEECMTSTFTGKE